MGALVTRGPRDPLPAAKQRENAGEVQGFDGLVHCLAVLPIEVASFLREQRRPYRLRAGGGPFRLVRCWSWCGHAPTINHYQRLPAPALSTARRYQEFYRLNGGMHYLCVIPLGHRSWWVSTIRRRAVHPCSYPYQDELTHSPLTQGGRPGVRGRWRRRVCRRLAERQLQQSGDDRAWHDVRRLGPHGGWPLRRDRRRLLHDRSDQGPLHVPVGGEVYRYGPGGFPAAPANHNYWVDVDFVAS
jgi:hypothetical protein